MVTTADGDTIYVSTTEDGTIWSLRGGAGPEPFLVGQPAPFALATDGVYLYATNRVVDAAGSCLPEGTLIAIPLERGEREVLDADADAAALRAVDER